MPEPRLGRGGGGHCHPIHNQRKPSNPRIEKQQLRARPHSLLTQFGADFITSHFVQPILEPDTPPNPQVTLTGGLSRNALRTPPPNSPLSDGDPKPSRGAAPHLREGRKLDPRPAPAGGPGLREPGGDPGPAGGGGGATSRRGEQRKTRRSRARRGNGAASLASTRRPGRRHAAPAPTNPRGERVLPLQPSRRVRRGEKKLRFPAALAAKCAGRKSSSPISVPSRPTQGREGQWESAEALPGGPEPGGGGGGGLGVKGAERGRRPRRRPLSPGHAGSRGSSRDAGAQRAVPRGRSRGFGLLGSLRGGRQQLGAAASHQHGAARRGHLAAVQWRQVPRAAAQQG